ncbi:hypothetical protein BC830DRAFT_889746 [Chytriomyces sp. MP71]|nr:hypothetical protein BC830DRAFT_889746 [Chytriomyces sp. MP71]
MSRKIGSAPVRTSISKPNISSPRRSSIYLHCDAIATKISKETAPLSKFLPFKTKVGEKAEKAVETRTSVSTLRSSASTVAASVASLDVDVQAKDETLSHPVSSTPHKSANSSDTRKCNGFKRFLEKTAQIFKFSAKRKEFIREPVPLQSTSDPHLAGQKFSIKSSTSSIAQPPSITLDDFTTTLAYDPAQHSIAPNMAPSINKPPSFHQQQQQQRTRSSAMSHHRDDVVIGTGLSLPRSFASTTACETPHISCSPRNSLQQSHNSSANHSCDSFGSPATRGSTGAPSGYNSSCSPSFGSALSTLHRPSAAVANTVYEDNYLVLGETMASLDRHRLAFRSAASSRRSAGSSSVRSVREGGKNALQDALGVSMAILSSDSGAASLSSGNGSGSVRWSGSESGNDGVGIPQTPDNTFIWREESVGEEPPMIRRSRSSPAVVVSIGGVENMKVAVGVELAKLYYDVCISELGVDEIAERMEAGEYVDHNAGSFSS